ncbi:YceI family protein [Acinetobacter sp. ANC 4216]|uniref:YceI family protein n=1 Tax=Acinetobacter sp. ANC 4216 TaxID=2529840 RepID=UPI00103FBDB3|nr:YceI family protein [Acinetobacter sp. ANC 4216]TCB71329.1 YceI family protein [Acinetobacter sp. ANC 4216]
MNIQTTLQRILILGLIPLGIVTQVNAQEWTLTPQTYVGFEVKSMGFSTVKGKFGQVQSSMSFDPAVPQNASARFVMQVNSLSLSKPSLKDMMMGENLFYVEKYPTATFNSREFIALGNHQYKIKGDLTLRGITRPVILDTSLQPNSANPQLMNVESKTVVKRSDFGMKKAFGGIGEKVNIEVSGQWQMK